MHDDEAVRHERYMRRCLELAALALESADSPVGAVVVRRDTVVGLGSEGVKARGDVTAHAEIVAVRAACAHLGTLDLTDATLYTTVEPCAMCAYAIRLARVGTVVIGARANAAGDSRCDGWHILTSQDAVPGRPVPATVNGVLAVACAARYAERRPPRPAERA